MIYQEIDGNIIELSKKGKFDVIVHGCNCFCVQKSGLAPQMVKAFQTDNFKMEAPSYKGSMNKLGAIDSKMFTMSSGVPDFRKFDLVVVNAYTQYYNKANNPQGETAINADYEAITLCMRKLNHRFKGKHIGLPKIGAGRAGGDWNIIKSIIQKELKDCQITIVIYNK